MQLLVRECKEGGGEIGVRVDAIEWTDLQTYSLQINFLLHCAGNSVTFSLFFRLIAHHIVSLFKF